MARHVVLFEGVDTADDAGLWVTNGTAAGTYELTGISDANTGNLGLDPVPLTLFNGEVLFGGLSANDYGLWVTKGTAAGTYELTGISGMGTSGLEPYPFTVINGEMLLEGIDAAGVFGLWVTN